MDDIVKQAMAKWPNVPHCYGWLRLDARGHWRMRDERAQHLDLPGDKLRHVALLGFIARNYGCDARGCWYFQNGPQRVYLDLEATPYIVRTDPAQGWLLHTGEPLGPVDEAWLSGDGALILSGGGRLAQLDDRDLAQVLAMLELDGAPVDDQGLLAWLEGDGGGGRLELRAQGRLVHLERSTSEQLAARYGFVRRPAPEPGGQGG